MKPELEEIIKRMPKGTSEKAKTVRKSEIENFLKRYVGKSFKNKQLSQPVRVIQSSIDEIAFHASKSYKSSVMALNFETIAEKATVALIDLPKDGKQSKRFSMWITVIMECHIDGVGTAKLTIGDSVKKENGKSRHDFLAYCVTCK